jgi:F-type H+-transporting ATPase subunit a
MSWGPIGSPSNNGIKAKMASEAHQHSPLDHVMDARNLEFPWGSVELGTIPLGPYELQITRFMVMELVGALLIAAIIIPLARHVAKNPITRGKFLNAFEMLVLFIRDNVARPAIGGHDADRFLPYLWTVFFFVLFNNVLGMIPGGASATANLNVTAVLAIMTLSTVLIAGMKAMGPVGFWVGLVPPLDVPQIMKAPMWLLMFVIEVAGLFIRHLVLAVRLFANILAGHIVLAVIVGFILTAGEFSKYFITPGSIAMAVALSLLELFIAFLQAYIFTFLSALFIGSAVHPHH